MNNSPATRPPRSGMVPAAVVVIVLALVFAGVLQVGHRLGGQDGRWLTANPVQAVVTWVKTGREWTSWHTTAAALAGLLLFALFFLFLRWSMRRSRRREHVDSVAQHMGRGETMTLKAVTAKNTDAGYSTHESVGVNLGKNVRGGGDLWAGWRSTGAAIMGPGSGKTSAVCVPMALDAPGWVYGTSNKRDFPDAIWEPRAERGTVWGFDPQDIADLRPTWYWNPLTYVTDDTHAVIQANLFADAAKDPEAKIDGFFDPKGRTLMAGLLLAAAIKGHPLTKLAEWVSSPSIDTPARILLDSGWILLGHDVSGCYRMPEETKRGVFANVAKILSFLFNRSALPWLCPAGPNDPRPQFDPHAFVRSSGDTLISLSKEGVGSLGPLVSALTIAVLDAAEEYARKCKGGRLPVPGMAILDEAANAVRDKQLPDRYSHYGSKGIFPFTILQSRAQGEAAWGKTGMDKLMGASTHRIYGRGIDDDSLLRSLSTMIGDRDELQYSTGSSSPAMMGGGNHSRSVNTSYHRVPIMDPATIHALPEWRAIISAAGERTVLMKLVPYFQRPGMAEAVAASNAKHSPEALVTV